MINMINIDKRVGIKIWARPVLNYLYDNENTTILNTFTYNHVQTILHNI